MKKELTAFRLSSDIMKGLRKISKDSSISISSHVSLALRLYLNETGYLKRHKVEIKMVKNDA